MAIFGTIALFLLGIWFVMAALVCGWVRLAFGARGVWIMIVPLCVGVYAIYLACKYGAFSLSVV